MPLLWTSGNVAMHGNFRERPTLDISLTLHVRLATKAALSLVNSRKRVGEHVDDRRLTCNQAFCGDSAAFLDKSMNL